MSFLQKPSNIYVKDSIVEEKVINETPEESIKESNWEDDFDSLFTFKSEREPEIIDSVIGEKKEELIDNFFWEDMSQTGFTVNKVSVIIEEPTVEEAPKPIVEPIHTPVIEEIEKPIVEPEVIKNGESTKKIIPSWGKPDGWNKGKPLFQRPDNWGSSPTKKVNPPKYYKSKRTNILKVLYLGITNQNMEDVKDQYRYDNFLTNFKIFFICVLFVVILCLIFIKTNIFPSNQSIESSKNNDIFNRTINWFVEKYFKK